MHKLDCILCLAALSFHSLLLRPHNHRAYVLLSSSFRLALCVFRKNSPTSSWLVRIKYYRSGFIGWIKEESFPLLFLHFCSLFFLLWLSQRHSGGGCFYLPPVPCFPKSTSPECSHSFNEAIFPNFNKFSRCFLRGWAIFKTCHYGDGWLLAFSSFFSSSFHSFETYEIDSVFNTANIVVMILNNVGSLGKDGKATLLARFVVAVEMEHFLPNKKIQ